MPPLANLRHEHFVQLYFADPEKNGERAYLSAGFKAKSSKDNSGSASACASALLSTPKLKTRLAELTERQIRRLDVSADKVVLEMARIAFSDIRNVVGRNGTIDDPRDWDDATAAAVAALEVEKLFEGTGKDRKHIGYTQKLKLWDKNQALTGLAKHFKLLNEHDPQQGMFAGANVQVNVYMPQKELHVVSNGHAAITNGHGTQE